MNGIKHTRVARYHPASNVIGGRFVHTVKQGLRKHSAGIKLCIENWLANFLLRYRCTSHSVTRLSPPELFVKRRLRNRSCLHDRSGVNFRELIRVLQIGVICRKVLPPIDNPEL